MNQESPPIVDALAPAAASTADISAFKQFVLAGGEVSAATLPGLVSRALSLSFAKVGGELVGVGAIKRPNQSYHEKVFSKAKLSQRQAEFEFELGWVYTNASARGKGVASSVVSSLVAALNGAPAYATSRTNNPHMHRVLQKFGFVANGAPYASALNGPSIQLFLRE